MQKKIALILLLCVWTLGCSSRSDESGSGDVVDRGSVDGGLENGGGTTDEPTTLEPEVEVASVRTISDQPTIRTGGSETVIVRALVTDADNRAIAGREVSFSSQFGVLQNISPVTDRKGYLIRGVVQSSVFWFNLETFRILLLNLF